VAVKLNNPPTSSQVEVAAVAHPAWQNLAAFVFGTASAVSLFFLLITRGINYLYLKKPLAVIGELADTFESKEFGPIRSGPPLLSSASSEHSPNKRLGALSDLWALADTLDMASHSMSLTKQTLADQKRQHLKWLAYLSHDLSSPLWRILKRLESLQYDTKLSEEQKLRLLELAQVEIIQSIEVIGSISQFATLESDIEQSFVEVEIRRLLEKTVDVFEFQACNQSIELDLRIGCDVGMARIERSLIRRALENLITNALRFTPEGGLISVGAQESGGMVHISISDTGSGIPDGDLPHIFDFTFRGEQQPRPGTIGSVGLGLAFVKRVVELHQGTVVARNLEPQGAEFVISIPAGSH
jgi:signal transduction histidine kinase